MDKRHRTLWRNGARRRTLLGFGTALTIAAGALTAPFHAAPAQAADAFSCTGAVPFFYNTTTGLLYRRDLRNPLTPSLSWGADEKIGSSGWTFGRILGGPGGRIYTINSTGLNRYRRVGTSWELVDGKQNWLISSSFTGYATAAFRDKITVDEAGDFYLIDNAGKLRWYRFDEPSRKWVISGKVIDTGWEKYNLVVATSPGVLYARLASGGTLHRYRFDPSTERWLMRDKLVGSSGFASFTKGLFTAGGDTLFGVQSTGKVIQYRYDEEAGGWPVQSQSIDGMNFPNVLATTNICHQGALVGPVKPSTPTQQHSPISVMQAPPADGAQLGAVEYSYVDNIGRTIHGRQTNPDAFSSIQWTPVESVESSTGKPSLVADKSRNVRLFAHQATSDIRMLTQSAPGSPAWGSWAGLAGGMQSEPVAVRLSDDTLALFGLDASGALWVRPQDGDNGDLIGWTKLGGSGLTGNPAVTVGTDGSATITAVDGTGAVQTATYRNRALTTPFTSIGGSGLTGTPAVVMMPGRRAMVFARGDDGTVKRQYQNADGTWSGTWSAVGPATVTAAGNPSAILDPNLGRVVVVTRTTDNTLASSWETAQGSEVWGDWAVYGSAESGPTYPADPTLFTFQNSNGTTVAFVSRTLNGSVAAFQAQDVNALARGMGAPGFTRATVPQLKR